MAPLLIWNMVFREKEDLQNVAGTGPYIATNVTPTQIDLTRDSGDYWGGDVKVDKITVKSFADGSALTAALQTGDVQGTYGLQYDNYVLFDQNPEYTIHSSATSRCFFGQFNMHLRADAGPEYP